MCVFSCVESACIEDLSGVQTLQKRSLSLRLVSPMYCLGEQEWRSGESARLPPICPGFDVGSLLCSGRFFSGNSGFPLSSKTNIYLIYSLPN